MFTGASTDHLFLQCPPMPMPTMDRKWKSNIEIAPNCPRCASSNTKFCYYNNYSLSQPRYFCKGCRRYWTKGGSLRNVPVGGGCRKNRRAKSASRLSQNERVSVNYSKSFNGFDHDNKVNEQNANGCSSDAHSIVQASGADIDMAIVFAKFLNQSSSNSDNPDELGPQELDNVSNSTPDSVQDDAMIECQQPSDHDHLVAKENFLEEFNQILVGEKQQERQEDQRVQDLLESDMNAAFELQKLLDDHDQVVQDLSWATDHATATFPNFTWQSVLQLQDFDSFPANDHQLSTSASNLIADNWSPSFDFSAGFEVYSRP